MTSSNNSVQDPNDLRRQILEELEQEHQEREERAQRKAERRKQKRQVEKQRTKAVEELRAQMRREFYKSKGYEERIDPTGRRVYLSPTELQNKKRKKSHRRRKKNVTVSSWLKELGLGDWPVYLGIALLAVIVGLILAGSKG